ncbi:MAG: apaH [Firmicutes bacterium]|nr:apaH [Bacillota bacterium]
MKTAERVLATSDIHGQNTKFLKLLEKAEYNPARDLLVVCGDIVDRGTENLDCIATCKELVSQGAVVTKGNHELFLEEVLTAMITDEDWRNKPVVNVWSRRNGGTKTIEEIMDLPKSRLLEILMFIKDLRPYFTVGDYIFSHAGADTSKPIEQNTENDLLWMNDNFPYCSAYPGKVMIFGHTPTWQLYNVKPTRKNAKIWYDNVNKDKLCVDCGGVFGGKLAAIELPAYREFYV